MIRSFIGPHTNARKFETLRNTSITFPKFSIASINEESLLRFIILFFLRCSAWRDSIVTFNSSTVVHLNLAASDGESRFVKVAKALSKPFTSVFDGVLTVVFGGAVAVWFGEVDMFVGALRDSELVKIFSCGLCSSKSKALHREMSVCHIHGEKPPYFPLSSKPLRTKSACRRISARRLVRQTGVTGLLLLGV